MDQTAQTDQVLNNFTNVNFYYSFFRLLLLFLLPYTRLLLLWWPWQLRLELGLTICALSAFNCLTPGQNTKNDYHFSDTSSWLHFSMTFDPSMHFFKKFSSCYICHMMFEITTSLSSDVLTNQIKLTQLLTLPEYLCCCHIHVSDPAERDNVNIQAKLGAFVLTSHLQNVQMDKKRILLNNVYLHSSDDKPPSTPFVSCTLCNICFSTVNCK